MKMKRLLLIPVALLCLNATGCPFFEEMTEENGGGGGAGGTNSFAKGYVYVKRSDRNVYVSDESNPSVASALTSSGGARHPSLSRDGRQVVYVVAVGAESELRVIPANGGTSSRVLGSSASERNFRFPVFSPSGAQIAFTYDTPSASAIGLVKTDGSGFTKLGGTGSFSYASPSFFPDGQSVLAVAGSLASGFTQLERLSISGGSTTSVTNNLGGEALSIANRAVLSPDGTRVVFDGQVSSGATRIFVMTLATKAVNRVTDYPGEPNTSDSYPAWEGSDRVVFSSDSGDSDNAYSLSASATRTSGGLRVPTAIEPWYGPF
jgi:TolB protein